MPYSPYEEIQRMNLIGEQVNKERLANAMARAKVQEVESAQRMKDQLMDLMQGYGTPGQRAEQLGGEKPALAQAMEQFGATGQTPSFTDFGGQSGIWATSKGVGPQFPVGMQNIQPTEPMPGMAQALAKHALGIQGNLPEETIAINKATQADIFKRSEASDVAREKRLEIAETEKEKRATAKAGEEEKKMQEFLVPRMNIEHLDKRLGVVEKQRATLQKSYDTKYNRIVSDPNFGMETSRGAKLLQDLTEIASEHQVGQQKLDAHERAVYKQMESHEKKLGLPSTHEMLYGPEGKGYMSPTEVRVSQLLERHLSKDVIADLARQGITPKAIVDKATLMGVTPEKLIADWVASQQGGPTEKPKKRPTAKVDTQLTGRLGVGGY